MIQRSKTRSPIPAWRGFELLDERCLLSASAWAGYAGDPQHTAEAPTAGQPLETIHWSTPVDTNPPYQPNGNLLVHYGSPVITAANTVIVPVRNATTGGFDLNAFDGATGAAKWSQTQGEEYVAPPASWIPTYAPTLATIGGSERLYFAGGSGTIFYRGTLDANGTATPTRIAFYGNANYNANPTAYAGVRISSPITADSQGNIFFSYRVISANPSGLIGGIARISAAGVATYADVGTPALDSAPALSLDETKLYWAIKSPTALLVRYNAATLAPLNQVALGSISDLSTAAPTIGPDGDVYFGLNIPNGAQDHGRGSLQHYSADLTTTYTSGSFGWDITVSIVPVSMVPSYSGPSNYLLMTKYNDYPSRGGSGVNKIAIVDPKTSQIDAVTGRVAMTTVQSIAGLTPDEDFPDVPGAVREWCINTAVVDPLTHSIFANNEDGFLYRWDTITNSFSERIQLTDGIGEAYTPTLMGADGTVYAINNATLFAIGRGDQVQSRLLFYDQSLFDDKTAGFNATDDNAIATDKSAYLPGSGTATFASVSGYTRGINGLMIDLAGVGHHEQITAADFTFAKGNSNSPGGWSAAPAPISVIVRSDAGVSGSDRVELIWANQAITDTWLQVTVRANSRTGLAASDVFYFGSKVGDTGHGDSVGFFTTATDEIAIRNNVGIGHSITSRYDVNRDGLVTATDQIIARNNSGTIIFLSVAAPAALRQAQESIVPNIAAHDLSTAALSRQLQYDSPADTADAWVGESLLELLARARSRGMRSARAAG